MRRQSEEGGGRAEVRSEPGTSRTTEGVFQAFHRRKHHMRHATKAALVLPESQVLLSSQPGLAANAA